uniref:Guanine nucleotide-binding protein-like 3 homolog n=1 Tax=Acrobeloides nanus TaxID=290746 RepID=A0A914C9Z6_9BILA
MAKYCLNKTVCEEKIRKKKEKKSGSKKKAEKPITIPNKCPFKEEILLEAEKRREELKQQQIQRKAEKKLEKKEIGEKRKNVPDIEALRKRLETKDQSEPVSLNQYVVEESEINVNANSSDRSVKSFASEVRKTIETADIVIEVLDARDPLGCRNRSIEKSILESGKRLVLLLNKIDLVPKENIKEWLKYLRSELPTIAFKASTQEQSNKLGRFSYSNLNSQSSKCIGADLVMKLLSNYCRNKDIKTSIRVGIIGYPNVGKSSVINSLKRRRACNTGAMPGVTRQTQEVELDKHIRLIDSPGVVFATKTQFDPVEVALKNAVRIESLADPVSPVIAILRRCSVKTLMIHFNIPEFHDCDQFLSLVARKLGRLKKGGRPDLNAAAKYVLNEWNGGKLRYYTEPPEKENKNEDVALCSTELLTTFSKEFDLDALDENVTSLVEDLPANKMECDTLYDPSKLMNETPEESGMEVDGLSSNKGTTVVTGAEPKKTVRFQGDESSDPVLESFNIDGNVQINRAIKLAVKKNKKKQRKTETRANKLADSMDTVQLVRDDQMDYDFGDLS